MLTGISFSGGSPEMSELLCSYLQSPRPVKCLLDEAVKGVPLRCHPVGLFTIAIVLYLY